MTVEKEPDEQIPEPVTVPDTGEGQRIDAFLAAAYSQVSRARIQQAIRRGGVRVDGETVKPSLRLKAGQQVCFSIPPPVSDAPVPEDIPLDVIYEDDDLVVINKPSAMVVHPAKGHWSGTLTAALAFRFRSLSSMGGSNRPGIVHRLDRDTSGVIIVARNDFAHQKIAAQFEARTVEKTYLALVSPTPNRDRDIVEKPIGAHPYQREKMAIRENHSTSRNARTFLEVQERFRGFALVLCKPKTGRTHQIRVHLAHWGSPVLADRLYSGRSQITRGDISGDRNETATLLQRQALHAAELELVHPRTDQRIRFFAPMPDDMLQTLESLRQHRVV